MNRLRFISALLLGACLVQAQRGDEREVLFAPGAAQFNPDQRVLLDAVAELVGNRADRAMLTYRSGFGITEELALERARAVRQFLIEHGVRKDRIRLRFEDPANPIAPKVRRFCRTSGSYSGNATPHPCGCRASSPHERCGR